MPEGTVRLQRAPARRGEQRLIRRRPRWRPGVAARALAVAAAVPLAACVEQAATPAGERTSDAYRIVFGISAALFAVVTIGILVGTAGYRRRAMADEALSPELRRSTRFELLWAAVPAAVAVALFAVSYGALDDGPASGGDAPMTIGVEASQWRWSFEYEDAGVTVSGPNEQPAEMAIPVQRDVRLRLESADVVHSFFVPRFLLKRDAIPGLTNTLDLFVPEEGTYDGRCAEYCGLGHTRMTFRITALDAEGFDRWLTEQQEASSPTPTATTPEPTATPTASEGVAVVAIDVAFDTETITVPAGEDVTIAFDNQDVGIPHNVSVYADDTAAEAIYEGEVIPGPATIEYSFPAPEPGTYYFQCDVHPNMNGDFVVE